MYYYNPYMYNMPYMQNDMYTHAKNDMYTPTKKDCMCGAGQYMPEYMPMVMKPCHLDKKCVKVPEIIGKNHCQVLIENEIPFAPCYPALEIKDITKEVKELIISVCKDKVLINGKLHKNINYKTFENVGKAKCHCEDLEVIYGDVKHVSVMLPFSAFIEIPCARPGDLVEVEYAGVEDCCELDILKCPCYVRNCKIPLYKMVKEKDVIKIAVKVLRPTQITV